MSDSSKFLSYSEIGQRLLTEVMLTDKKGSILLFLQLTLFVHDFCQKASSATCGVFWKATMI